MSIIQTIRDKGALISAIIIAVALLGFIAMDAFTGRSNLFGGGPSTTVGVVNGERIGIDEFQTSIQQQEAFFERQGYGTGEAVRQQAIDAAWNQQVGRIVITEEMDKLGIRVSEKELSNSILFGPNPPEDLKAQFTDQQTGLYNPQLAAQQINNMLKKGTAEQKANISAYINQLKFVRMTEKYSSLLTNSMNFPKWMLEKQNIDNSLMASISVVRKPYSEISDSSATVSDAEIEDYIKKHKDDFIQKESRSISYVSFSAAPSAADSNVVKDKMLALKKELETAPDVRALLASEGAEDKYYDGYISGKTIQVPFKDSIFKIPAGTVYGPYLDRGNYSIAKLISSRPIPDSVKVRHILIATISRDQNGQVTPVRDTATAKNIADSVFRVLQAGQSFDSLVVKVSDDPGSKEKGGVYDIASGQMVPAFNDFAFTKPVGAREIVKTEFGYHIMEVLSQRGSSTGYKIAYLTRPILTSSETDQNANNAASKFAGNSKDEKSFNENFEKELKPKGINKGYAIDIKPASSEIIGLGPSRPLVKKIYEAKEGEVLQPELVGSDYVVAVVTHAYKDGTQTALKARPSVEPVLRNHKKAEIIKKQIGNITTLEAASTALGKPIEPIDSLRITGQSKLGYEPKVLGASFNPDNRGKVVPAPLEGISGVYVIRVDNVTATAVSDANVAEQRKARYEQMKGNFPQMGMQFVETLKEAAKVKDYRDKHY